MNNYNQNLDKNSSNYMITHVSSIVMIIKIKHKEFLIYIDISYHYLIRSKAIILYDNDYQRLIGK